MPRTARRAGALTAALALALTPVACTSGYGSGAGEDAAGPSPAASATASPAARPGTPPAEPSPTTPPSSTPPSPAPPSGDRLSGTRVVTSLDRGDGSPPRLLAVVCDPPGGDVAAPDAACALLAELGPDGLTAVEGGTSCAQVVGGPETAVVEGVVAGEEVRTSLSRTDACATARWDRLAPLLTPAQAPSR